MTLYEQFEIEYLQTKSDLFFGLPQPFDKYVQLFFNSLQSAFHGDDPIWLLTPLLFRTQTIEYWISKGSVWILNAKISGNDR